MTTWIAVRAFPNEQYFMNSSPWPSATDAARRPLLANFLFAYAHSWAVELTQAEIQTRWYPQNPA